MRKPIPSVERLRRRESERDKKRGERERERELFYNNKSTSGTRYQYIPRDIINYICRSRRRWVVVLIALSSSSSFFSSSAPHRLVQITAEKPIQGLPLEVCLYVQRSYYRDNHTKNCNDAVQIE